MKILSETRDFCSPKNWLNLFGCLIRPVKWGYVAPGSGEMYQAPALSGLATDRLSPLTKITVFSI
jgi:hypothetical protein